MNKITAFSNKRPQPIYGKHIPYKDTAIIVNGKMTKCSMRPSQEKIFKEFKNTQHLIVNQPQGSGKSTISKFVFANELKQNPERKTIIVVPQTLIKKSFNPITLIYPNNTENKPEELWNITNDLCEPINKSKKIEIIKFLKKTQFVKGISERKLICTHAAFAAACSKIKNPSEVFKNTSIIIDEAHHILSAENGNLEIANKLGNIISNILESNHPTTKIWLYTATFYRGDRLSILPEKHLNKFTNCYMPFDDHWLENLPHLEDFTYDYVIYKEHPYNEIKTILQNSKVPTIIYCPANNQQLAKNNKINFVNTLIQHIKEVWPTAKILNLVNELFRDIKKDHFVNQQREYDIVLTIDMMNEGVDWEKATQIIDLFPRNSLRITTQRFGRLTRHYENKKHIHYYSFLAFPLDTLNEEERRTQLSKNFNYLLASMILEDAIRPIPLTRAKINQTLSRSKCTNSLQFQYVDFLQTIVPNESTRLTIIENVTKNLITLKANEETLKIKVNNHAIKQSILNSLQKHKITGKDAENIALQLVLMWKRRIPNYAEHVSFDLNSDFDKIWDNRIFDTILSYGSGFCKTTTFSEFRSCLSGTIYNPTGNKALLLQMARNGEKKPTRKTKLGALLCSYTTKSQYSYDPDFEKEIRILRPDWFISQSYIVNEKKNQLLEMARNGEKKPHWKTKLGKALYIYACKTSSSSYDPEFDKEIRTLRPDWFITRSDITKKYKRQLLHMAKNGEKRPTRKTKLGLILSNYLCKTSESYDPELDKELRTLRPDWLITRSDITKKYKRQLLQIAKNGEKRPTKKTKLGALLCSYTTKSQYSYDPDFEKEIRTLRPDWFISQSDIANEKKNQLLEMARNGEKRPPRKTKLGKALIHYTNNGYWKGRCSYDPEFDKTIKTLRPDWFMRKSTNKKIQGTTKVA